MSVNTDQVIQILPLPDNTFINGNKVTITGLKDRGIAKYAPNGDYEISASSYASGDKQPYAICNEDEQDFWQCDFKSNPNYKEGQYSQYTKNPYTGGNTPSSYQGGGYSGNTWTTPVGTNNVVQVRGEWIQVHIPYKAYIQQYSIRTPTYTQHNTFPRKFMLAASQNGTEWVQLDQRNLRDDDVPTGADIKKSFDINSPEKYSYFRLIVMGMGPNMETIKINEFGLFGTTMIAVNPRTVSETFVTLKRSSELSEDVNQKATYDGINMYDKQYAKYNLPNVEQDKQKPENKQLETETKPKEDTKENNGIITVAMLPVIMASVLTGIIVYRMVRK
jgi:hypothetical protein